jgi:hypothetical protein
MIARIKPSFLFCLKLKKYPQKFITYNYFFISYQQLRIEKLEVKNENFKN